MILPMVAFIIKGLNLTNIHVLRSGVVVRDKEDIGIIGADVDLTRNRIMVYRNH